MTGNVYRLEDGHVVAVLGRRVKMGGVTEDYQGADADDAIEGLPLWKRKRGGGIEDVELPDLSTESDATLDAMLDEWDRDVAEGDYAREWGPLSDALCTVRTLSGSEITARIDTLGNGCAIVVRREDGPWYSIPLERQHSIKTHVTPPGKDV